MFFLSYNLEIGYMEEGVAGRDAGAVWILALKNLTVALLIKETIFLVCLFLYCQSTGKPLLEERWYLLRD